MSTRRPDDDRLGSRMVPDDDATTDQDGTRRVVVVASAYAPHRGGVEELVAQLAREQRTRGIDTTVFTMRWPKSLPPSEVIDGTPVRRFVFRTPTGGAKRVAGALLSLPITLLMFIRAVKRVDPDLIHVQCVSSASWFAVHAARVLRLPLVVTLQGELTMDSTRLYERSAVARSILRLSLRHADLITACSRDTLEEAENWYGEPFGARGQVIHNGVDVSAFTAGSVHDEGVPYVFAIGRLVREKGFDILLRALPDLVEDQVVQRVLVAGDGPERPELERLAHELDLDDVVRFVGATDRPTTIELFRGATAFVLPSRHEPFGIVNLEAMAAGVPVVATNVGGVSEFVRDGENGLLVAPQDPDALGCALRRMLTDPDLAQQLVAAGRVTSAEHDWALLAESYADRYQQVWPAAPGQTQDVAVDGDAPTRTDADILERQRSIYAHNWSVADRPIGFPDRLRQRQFAPLLAGRTLDVGCGDGALARGFPRARIVGIDQSLAGLALSSEPGACAIAERLPVARASVDTLVISEVLEHVADPIEALRECHHALRRGGQIIVTVPTVPIAASEAVYRRIRYGVWPHHPGPVERWDPEHERRFDPDEICRLLRDAGFEPTQRTRMFGSASTLAVYLVSPRLPARWRDVVLHAPTLHTLDQLLRPFGYSSVLVVADRR
jgi:glycosyltransferase involved in cell wall biosynthesis/SAM-dependent methyltransferase